MMVKGNLVKNSNKLIRNKNMYTYFFFKLNCKLYFIQSRI